MIGKTLQQILKEKNTNPNELAKKTNISNQTIYSIIKRDNMKIDFEVLLKICSALDVDIERFYSDYLNSPKQRKTLTPHQIKVIDAYIAQPEMQSAVDKLLGINSSDKYSDEIPLVARSGAAAVIKPTHSKEERNAALDKEIPGVSTPVKPKKF